VACSSGNPQGSFLGSPSMPSTATLCGTGMLAPQTLTVADVPVPNPAPSLDWMTPTVQVPVVGGAASATVSFRLLDSWRDVDISTVTVTNLQADPPVAVAAYYASDQLLPDGDWSGAVPPVTTVTTTGPVSM
jgi:hypothetical protein